MKFFFLLVSLLLFSCGNQREENQDLNNIKKQLVHLEEKSQQLEREILELKQELQQERTNRESAIAASEAVKSQEPEMTTERLKRELAPLMKEVLHKIKEAMETPPGGKGYGMRVEFDLVHAVYGLVRTGDPEIPYRAKVIVPYEKFVVSDVDSKSYGQGTTLLEFVCTKDHWVLLKQNQ